VRPQRERCSRVHCISSPRAFLPAAISSVTSIALRLHAWDQDESLTGGSLLIAA
jgi:hypothetical protein